MVFEAGGYPLAAKLGQVRKAYFEGEAIPEGEILELGKILGRGQGESKYYLEVSASGRKIPVRVNKIEPIKDLQLAVWLEFPRLMRRPDNKMLKGFFFDGSRMIALLDFEQVFGAART